MSTSGVTLINTEPSSTMYMVSATGGNSRTSPTNMDWTQIMTSNSGATSQQFTYDSNHPITQSTTNSVTQSTGGSSTTYMYVWINKGDPSSTGNTTTLSDVVTSVSGNGLMVTSTSTSTKTVPTGAIIQYTGNATGVNNLFYVYNKDELTVKNNSSSTIQIQTKVSSTSTIPGRTSTGVCPATITFPSSIGSSQTNSAVRQITANGSTTIVSAFPTDLNGAAFTSLNIWTGSTVSAGTGVSSSLIFRPVDFMSFHDCHISPATLQMSWNQTDKSVTITDVPANGGTGGIGQPCAVPSDCTSGACKGGVCVASGTTTDTNGGGFPWWGWLIIVIIVIIIIGLIIFAVSRSKKKKGVTSTTETHVE